ncbi:MAG: extracellular solute-binding protein, partial [Pyrobaculum sp.]
MVTRRKLLVAIGAAAVLAAVGGGFMLFRREEGAAARGGELAVYNYSYFIDKELLPKFEKEHGIKVIYEEFESGEMAYSALLRGGGGYDLVVVPDTYLRDVIKKGLVKRMDHNKLSNIGNVDPAFFNNPNDPGLQYSVPYAFGTTGFAVNYYAMKADFGRKLDSW